MTRTPLLRRVLAGTAVALLAACSDSPSVEITVTPPPVALDNDVPATALASPDTLADWARGQAASDTATPLRVNGVMPPVSDTAEPLSLGTGT